MNVLNRASGQVCDMREDPVLRQRIGWDGKLVRKRYPDVDAACKRGEWADPFFITCRSGAWKAFLLRRGGQAQRGEPWQSIFDDRSSGRRFVGAARLAGAREPSKTFLLKLTNGFFEILVGAGGSRYRL